MDGLWGDSHIRGCCRPAEVQEMALFQSACFTFPSARGAEVSACSCTGSCNSAGEGLKQHVARPVCLV